MDKCAQAGSWSSSWLQLPQPTPAWPTEAVMLRAYTTQNVILIIMLMLRLLTFVVVYVYIKLISPEHTVT